MPAPSSDSDTTTAVRVDETTGASTQALRPLDLAGRAVLLATDGSPGALAAARLAHALATTHHARIHVVSVVDTRGAPIPPPLDMALALGGAVVDESIHADQGAIREELSGATGASIDWPVRTRLGTPAASIVKEAQHVGAVLVILGLRRHGRLDRAVHDETTLNVMRRASCPVLGVVAEMKDLPRRVLSAVDFSEGSLLAVRSGEAVTGEHAVLVLAYVQPMNGFLDDEGECRIHDMGVQAGFAKLRKEFGDDGVKLDQVVLHHTPAQSPAQALLDYAEQVGSDLITAGSVQHSRLDRWMVGSVSGELVRDGRRSVLIVPPRRRA
ncbi:MAG TPA: universal stress protein [Gemmatimonadaceae bacterium]